MTTATKLQAFHNDPAIKEKYVARVQAHALADEIIKGKYWQDGKGCAVGCTVHSGQHSAYETELGIPRWLARLEDRIFEGMPNEHAKEFPLRFLSAIRPGADLEPVKAKFFHWLLVDEACGVIRHAKKESTRKAIQDVADMYQLVIDGESVTKDQWRAAAAAAYAADAYAAYAAAAADAYAAAAADAAAAAAAYAADAAAAYAAYAAAAAKQNAFYRQSEKLLQLLSEA